MKKIIAKGAASIAWATIWYFRWFIVLVILALATGLFIGYEMNDKDIIVNEAPGAAIKASLESKIKELEKDLQLMTTEQDIYKRSFKTQTAMRETLEATFTHRAVDKYEIIEYELTAYCPCDICCGDWSDGYTKSMTRATAGRTIAVDPDLIPLGSTVYIEGLGIYIAEDTGSAIGGNIIDVYFDDHQEALNFGRQTANVIVLQLGGDNE